MLTSEHAADRHGHMLGDWVYRTDLMVDAREAGLTPDVEENAVDAGHWSMYDPKVADEVGSIIIDWLQRKAPVRS